MNAFNFFSTSRTICCALLLLTMAATPGFAATIDYAGSAGPQNFTDGANWVGGIAPGPSDLANINVGDGIADYTYIDTAVSIQRFQIGQFVGNSGGLEIRSGGSITSTTTSANYIGARAVGHLRILEGSSLNLGGSVTVGGGFTVSPFEHGTGTVTQSGGSFTGAGLLTLGTLAGNANDPNPSSGTYNMQGGTLTLTNGIDLGPAGIGTLNLSNGAVTSTYFQIGRANGGSGTVIQTGGSYNSTRVSADYGLVMNHATTGGGTAYYEISGGSINVEGANAGFRNGGTGDGATSTLKIIGNAPTITIATGYTQSAGAKLALEIGSGISPITLGGNALLDGTLEVKFTTTPAIGQEFTILNYGGTLAGGFSTFDDLVDSPAGVNSVKLSINYGTGNAGAVVLKVISPAVPGDFDSDGDVDGADFVVWQTNFPAASGQTLSTGDADADGDVDGADFVVWQTNFPTAAGPGVAAVPEPSGLVLITLAMAAGVAMIRRQ